MRIQRTHRPRSGKGSGFTLIELAVSLALFGVIMSITAIVTSTARGAFLETRSGSSTEAKLSIALDRIAVELLTVSRETLIPELTGMINDTSDLSLQQVVGVQNGVAIFGNITTFRFETDPGEVIDGVDNDGDGLVDEGRVVMIRDVGLASEVQTTLCRNVRRHLEGEFAGGGDENANGLTDELGFLIQRVGDVLTLQLTVEQITPEGRELIRTAETSVRLRN
jgi:prepilin-type N-terminal cleavage/methylation domain-containing protein